MDTFLATRHEAISMQPYMQAVMLAVSSALLWGAPPLITRYFGMDSSLMPMMIGIGGALVALPFISFPALRHMEGGKLALGIGVGVLNGIGTIFFYKLIEGSQRGVWSLAAYAPITYVLVPVVIAAGSIYLFKEGISLNKTVGISLAVFAIAFLSK